MPCLQDFLNHFSCSFLLVIVLITIHTPVLNSIAMMLFRATVSPADA